MKKITILIIALLVSACSTAADPGVLSTESLQGEWAIMQMADMEENGEDSWLFDGNQFYQVLGGQKISPDAFTVSGDVIDLDYAKIQVHVFDGETLEASMAGFRYRLVRK